MVSKSLPKPYSSCLYDGKSNLTYTAFQSHLDKTGFVYSYMDCTLFCKDEFEKKDCPNLNRGCLNQRNLKEVLGDLIVCTENCPIECETVEYKHDLSYLNFPNENYFTQQGKSLYFSLRK